jgi:hypothetical protein
MMCNKKNYYKTLAFWLQKPPTYSICEKYMVEVSCNASMSKSGVSFENFHISIRGVPNLVEKIKQEYVLPKPTYIILS